MTEVVLDASVIVKWAFPDRAREAHAERALNLLHAVHAGRLSVVEPPHWLAEVAAVVTRLAPDRAPDVVALMHAMEFPVLDELEVYLEATRLSAESGQHVFDTLYHAVAVLVRNPIGPTFSCLRRTVRERDSRWRRGWL